MKQPDRANANEIIMALIKMLDEDITYEQFINAAVYLTTLQQKAVENDNNSVNK